MKYYGLLLFNFLSSIAIGQAFIHAHNDYQQAAPLTNALWHKVFSLEADVDRTYVTDVENGRRNVSVEILERLIKALGVSIAEFFNSKEFKK